MSPPCCPSAWGPDVQTHPPFPEAQPPQPGSVGEKRVRWLNITSTYTTPAPAPRAHTPLWCSRPGQLHQETEQTDWCGRVSMRPQTPLSCFLTSVYPERDLPRTPFTGICHGGFGGPVGRFRTPIFSGVLLACLLSVPLTKLFKSRVKKSGVFPFDRNKVSLSARATSTYSLQGDGSAIPTTPGAGAS